AVFLEALQKQESLEHARVLYVALTRGIHSAFLSWTGKPQRGSFAEMATLVQQGPGEHQEPNYVIKIYEEALQPKRSASSEDSGVIPRAAWAASQNVEAPKASLSVTEILEGGVKNAKAAEPRDVKTRMRVVSQGTNVHRLMELLKYPSQDRLHVLIKRWFPNQEAKILSAIEFVRDLKSPPLLEIIAAGFVEWGFVLLDEGRVIEGQVDLWGRDPDGAPWIVDYKTGSPEMREKAFDQMQLYALALRKSGEVKESEELRLVAVYPFDKKVFVETAPTNAVIRKKFST
ncbi:MAG: PD-(D/E)XK nuclease family protein, partial [Bdellovibrionota bacterium]